MEPSRFTTKQEPDDPSIGSATYWSGNSHNRIRLYNFRAWSVFSIINLRLFFPFRSLTNHSYWIDWNFHSSTSNSREIILKIGRGSDDERNKLEKTRIWKTSRLLLTEKRLEFGKLLYRFRSRYSYTKPPLI